jgi:dienelactone hydrolase
MNQNLKIGNPPISFIRNLVLTSTFLFAFSAKNSFSQTTQNTYRNITKNIYSNVGGYGESLPNDYAANPTKKYPLIVFLHGSGELGDGSSSSLDILHRIGITRLLWGKLFPASFSYGGANYSFIVVAPQMKTSSDWTNSIQAVIDYCKKTYRVDEDRIYLTGLSLGGVGAWNYSTSSVSHGQSLAATLLVCPGATATSTQLKNIGQSQLPIWITNNSNDPINLVSGALTLLSAINSAIPAPPKAWITIFDKSGHDAWTQTYDPAFTQNGLNVYQWMLSHSRSIAQSPASPVVVTASAGANQVITLPVSSVTLDASGSKVSSGSIASYAWSKISGPSSGTISSASSAKTSVTNMAAGTYKFQVTVKASDGSTASATVTVTVNASTDPPSVNAGKGGTITLPTNTFTLDGSLSKASAGNTIVSYKWIKSSSSPAGGDITNPTSVVTTVTNLREGTYVYTLYITDSRGSTWSGGTTIYVKPAPVTASTDPPTADPGKPGYITLPTNTYTFDGSGSTASTGNTIASYLWTKRSGPAGGNISSPNSAKTTMSNLQEGTYIYDLTVVDSRGASSKTGTYIIVDAGSAVSNDPPIAVPSAPGYITLPTSTYTFDGSASRASTGNKIVSYLWTKRSGPAGGSISSPNSVKTTISNLQEGYYIIDLTVTDDKGRTSTTGTYIFVYPATQLEAVPGKTGGYITLPTNSYTFDGSGSTAAPGTKIVSYRWTKRSGPAGGSISSPNSAQTTMTNLQEGYYVYDLTVTDNLGNTSTTGTYIFVYAAGTSNRSSAVSDSSTPVINNISVVSEPVISDALAPSALDVTVNPNPVISDMNILIKGSTKGKTNIAIYNINGKMLQQQEFNKDGSGSVNKTVNISKLPSGIYLVQVMVDGKFRKVMKVVKQ